MEVNNPNKLPNALRDEVLLKAIEKLSEFTSEISEEELKNLSPNLFNTAGLVKDFLQESISKIGEKLNQDKDIFRPENLGTENLDEENIKAEELKIYIKQLEKKVKKMKDANAKLAIELKEDFVNF